MKTIKHSTVDEALAYANLRDGEDGVNVRADYSGRGMYGTSCFGVDFDRASDSYKFAMALIMVMAEQEWSGEVDALNLAQAAVTDSMGCGMILYFPGYALED